jgi:catechol 2,3-dioxygenase-like lactoylglutathione lyase family enzyme
MAASVAFFEDLGAEVIHGGPDSGYVLMQLGTVQIGLLVRPADPATDTGPGAVELSFAAAMPLDDLEQRLRGRGVTIAKSPHNTDFGPQLHVRTPDGLLLKIGQLELDE